MPAYRRLPVWSLVVVLVLMTAWGALTVASPTAHAQRASTLVIGTTDLPVSLDPAEAYDFATWEVLSHLYVGLVRQVPGSVDYELALASNYDVSHDGLEYTFTLRDGIAFADGTPITAQTFVDSIQRVLLLRRAGIALIEPYVVEVVANGDRELVFRLNQPTPYFLQLLALPAYFPQHPDLVTTTRPQPFDARIISNGPYTVESFEVHQSLTLRVNPAYTEGPPPTTDIIVLRQFNNPQELRRAMQQHEIDIAWRALLLDDLRQLELQEDISIIETRSTRVFYMYMGQTREPTDDPMVREALTLLVDRATPVADVFMNHATPLVSLVPPEFPDAYVPIWPSKQSIPEAEATLRAASYKERGASRLNITINFSYWLYGVPYAEAVNRLARASFQETDFVDYGVFNDIESNTFMNILEEGATSLAVFAWTPVVPHPYAYVHPLFHSSQLMPANSRYARPEIDALLNQLSLIGDPETQRQYYAELSDWVLDDHAIIPLWQDHVQLAVWNDIDGIVLEPNFFLHYDLLRRQG